MADQALRRSFIALHLTVVLVALVQSTQTLHHAVEAMAEHQVLAMFGGLQLLAGLLFLWPRTLRISGMVLVVVFVHAALFEAANGAFPAASLVCAAAALFVAVHGAAWRIQSAEASGVAIG